ncbi:MAG: AbrB/MazE/SpoVT family DNA-binding domain-containing protein [bacterium]
MSRRKMSDNNIRKIIKNGDSYSITIPIELIREFGWKEKQKLVIKKRGKGFNVSDWEKS